MVTTTSTVDVDAVRAAHPIAEVIADSGVQLRPVGRGYMACCPFHDDSTASMSIDAVPDRFHCFGCGAGGDVIDYIQRRYHLTFLDAVAHLDHHTPTPSGLVSHARTSAAGPGMPVPVTVPVQRAYAVHQLAWAHYTTPVAHETAVGYLNRRRRIDVRPLEDHVGHPVAGVAGSGWTSLVDDLRRHGVTDDELLALDLAQVSARGHLIDALRNRIILPVRTATSDTADAEQILGFVGRDITGDPRAPKYRNPTRTATFEKSTMLYQPTVTAPGSGSPVVVVEGPLDALAIAATTATAGRHTHLTPCSTGGTSVSATQARHVAELAREADGLVVLALDGDTAGRQGTLRWVDTFHQVGVPADTARIRVAHLPSGRDPADWLAQHAAAGLDIIDPTRAGNRSAPLPPGAEIAHLALERFAYGSTRADTGDPTRAVIEALRPLAGALAPADSAALLATATREMRRQGWDPHGRFTAALHHAGLIASPVCRPTPGASGLLAYAAPRAPAHVHTR
jgi:DNA primase